jgi:transposase
MIVEHLDDLPVIGHYIDATGIRSLFDAHFPDHGHWSGLNGGKVVAGWLSYILTEGDHRLSHVESWAASHLNGLSVTLDAPDIRSVDFCDDKLGRLLDRMAVDDDWNAFEQALGRNIVQVYRPAGGHAANAAQVVRADAFNVPQFREAGELFRHGYSKQRRADLPFCKVMVGYLDNLGIPLTVDVVKGSGPDYGYYLPTINRIRDMLGCEGNLYVADSNMGSVGNRSAIQASVNFYLCPLNNKQVVKEKEAAYLDLVPCAPEELPGLFTGPDDKRDAVHYFELAENVCDGDQEWVERRILIHSPAYAQGLHKSFKGRLDEAEEQIRNLVIFKRGRRNPKTMQDLHERIGVIAKKYDVEGCFDTQCGEEKTTVSVQKYKDRPVREVVKSSLSLTITRKEMQIAQRLRTMGWQIYGSNAPEESFSTAQLVEVYRDQYSIEHLFDFFLNRDVGLLPVYLKKEARVKALIRLLSLAMKCSMLIQYMVRAELGERGEEMKGVYAGNKGRKTNKPTTPMLLKAFKGVSIVCVSPDDDPSFRMVALNDTQRNILDLMGQPHLYTRIADLLKTHAVLRET